MHSGAGYTLGIFYPCGCSGEEDEEEREREALEWRGQAEI
jgi:hypothetical protein